MPSSDSRVSHNLRRLRQGRGVSLAHLGRVSGVSARKLSRVEKNQGELDAAAIARIAQALRVTPEEIGGDRVVSTAEVIASSMRQREAARELCEDVEDLLATARALFQEIEKTRARHNRK